MKIYDQIVKKNIKDIKPYFRNPRNNEHTVRKLIETIPLIGFNVPILIDKNGVIIKGHSRFYAAKELGFEEVPCIISEASDELNRKDRLLDNAIQELSEWKIDELNVEARELDLTLDWLDEMKDASYSNTDYDSNLSKEELEKAQKEKEELGIDDENIKVTITCPHCSGSFQVTKKDMEARWK